MEQQYNIQITRDLRSCYYDRFKCLAKVVMYPAVRAGAHCCGKTACSPCNAKKAMHRCRRFAGREYFVENLMVAVFFHLHYPRLRSPEEIWSSFVSFCNIYSFFRFMMVMGCCAEGPAGKDELFRAVVHASRCLLHNSGRREELSEQFFENASATLAHMAVLLSG